MKTQETQPQEHTRINITIFSKPERAFIDWFLSWAPDWVTPDMLTAIGFGGSLLIFAGYCLTLKNTHFLWLVNFGLLLNWFGDSTDGNMARQRKIERPRYGFFLDHSVDSIGEVLIFIGLGISPFVQFNIALLALVGYLLLSVFVFLDTFVNSTFQISFARLGPTEARVIIIIANVLMFAIGNPTYQYPFGVFTLYDFIVMGVTFLLYTFYLTMIVKRLRYLAKLEPEQEYHSDTKK
ncbi:MAG: CDP-alcohol phosphatidyltransferase family protein [Anaerolineaceae bacterium]|nr:CDP-alcohol phosphatidyltransferase family protein [Anaerolineaceae bacterium]